MHHFGLGVGLLGYNPYPTVIYDNYTSPYSVTNVYQDIYNPPPVTQTEVYYEDSLATPPDADAYVPPADGSSGVPSAPPAPEADAADVEAFEPTLVDLGNAAFNVGEYDEAMRYFVTALLTDDQDAFARLFYGMAQFAKGDYALASMAMRRAIAMDPTLVDRPIDVRSIYPDEGTFTTHVSDLEAFVAQNPANADALFLLGYIYFASAAPENAITTLERLTTIDEAHNPGAQVLEVAKSIVDAQAAQPEPKGE